MAHPAGLPHSQPRTPSKKCFISLPRSQLTSLSAPHPCISISEVCKH